MRLLKVLFVPLLLLGIATATYKTKDDYLSIRCFEDLICHSMDYASDYKKLRFDNTENYPEWVDFLFERDGGKYEEYLRDVAITPFFIDKAYIKGYSKPLLSGIDGTPHIIKEFLTKKVYVYLGNPSKDKQSAIYSDGALIVCNRIELEADSIEFTGYCSIENEFNHQIKFEPVDKGADSFKNLKDLIFERAQEARKEFFIQYAVFSLLYLVLFLILSLIIYLIYKSYIYVVNDKN